jgi:dihydroorotase (multifunctional complex type)
MMEDFDMVIRNGRFVRHGAGITAGDLGISDGKIVSIDSRIPQSAKVEIEARRRFVIPGVIDTHVHLGTTGQTFSESLKTESSAAVAGGITTLLVYKQIPVFTEAEKGIEENFGSGLQAIEEHSLVDIGFHGLILDEQALDRIDELVEGWGITSFKFVMAYKGEEAMPHFYGMGDGALYKALDKVGKKTGCLSIVHAENSEINERFKRENAHRQDIAAWSDSRPPLSEEVSIRKAVFLAEKAGSPLCIAHVSTAGGAQYIASAKKQNRFLFQETCPHYLTLTKHHTFDLPALGKVNPPLREQSDVSSLWQHLARGEIDVIGTDHAPFTLQIKSADLWHARPGLPGLGLLLPILLSEGVNKGRLSLEDLVRITSYQPAQLFGLCPEKGRLEIGADADLVIIDLEKEMMVTPEVLHGFSDYSPYKGFSFTGWPVTTVVKGKLVFQDGQVHTRVTTGRYLKRKRAGLPLTSK